MGQEGGAQVMDQTVCVITVVSRDAVLVALAGLPTEVARAV